MAMSCLSAPLVAGGHLNHCNWDSNSNCAIWPRRCKVQLSRVRLRCCRLVSLVRKPLRQRVGSNSCLFRNTDRIVLFGLVLVMLPIPFNLNSWKSSEIIAWTFRLVSCLRADCGFLFDLLFLPNNDAASTRPSRTERSLMFWYRLYQNWKWANVAQFRNRHLLQSMSSLGTKHGSLPVFFFLGSTAGNSAFISSTLSIIFQFERNAHQPFHRSAWRRRCWNYFIAAFVLVTALGLYFTVILRSRCHSSSCAQVWGPIALSSPPCAGASFVRYCDRSMCFLCFCPVLLLLPSLFRLHSCECVLSDVCKTLEVKIQRADCAFWCCTLILADLGKLAPVRKLRENGFSFIVDGHVILRTCSSRTFGHNGLCGEVHWGVGWRKTQTPPNFIRRLRTVKQKFSWTRKANFFSGRKF